MSAVSSKDSNTSLTFAGFLIMLVQNVLAPGSQLLFPINLFKLYSIKKILSILIVEIQVEIKRRKLKLPWVRPKFNIFKKKENQDFIFKYPRS